jgi:hypothetical protein
VSSDLNHISILIADQVDGVLSSFNCPTYLSLQGVLEILQGIFCPLIFLTIYFIVSYYKIYVFVKTPCEIGIHAAFCAIKHAYTFVYSKMISYEERILMGIRVPNFPLGENFTHDLVFDRKNPNPAIVAPRFL